MSTPRNLADFFGRDWPRIKRMRDSYHHADDRRVFIEGLVEHKKANPNFRFDDLFPEQKREAQAAYEFSPVAAQVCSEVLAVLAKHRAEPTKIEDKPRSEFELLLGELIELGAGKFQMCLWPPIQWPEIQMPRRRA